MRVLEILGMEIFKNESETLRIFGNLVYGNLKKNNPELYGFLEIWRMGIFKNESETFVNFWNLGYGNLENEFETL